jgi:hypothetical protein
MGFKNYIWDEQFDLNVARRKVRGASAIHKFGATPAQSTNTTATVWDKSNTLYPWNAFDTPGVLVGAQVGVDDNAKIVTIVGLDSNWDIIEEDFTLSSTGTVIGTKIFRRVFRGYIKTGATNVGQLNFFRAGVEVLRITEGLGQTLMSIYTIPNGYTGYLYQGVCSAQAGADATGFMMIRYNTVGQAFRVGHTFEVSGSGGEYFYKFAFPQEIPEHSDIDIRLTTRSNNGRYTASFDLLLIREDFE